MCLFFTSLNQLTKSKLFSSPLYLSILLFFNPFVNLSKQYILCPLCGSLSLQVSVRQCSVLCLPSLLTEPLKGTLSKSLFSVSLPFFASFFHQSPSHPTHCYQINHLKNFPLIMLLLGFKTPSVVFNFYRKMDVVGEKQKEKHFFSPHAKARLACLFSEFPINLLHKLSTQQPMYLITAF